MACGRARRARDERRQLAGGAASGTRRQQPSSRAQRQQPGRRRTSTRPSCPCTPRPGPVLVCSTHMQLSCRSTTRDTAGGRAGAPAGPPAARLGAWPPDAWPATSSGPGSEI
jgi:hypothetical protein